MATITREQAVKLDKQAPGKWGFDLHHYLIWNEKTVRRVIDLDSGRKLEARIVFTENYITHHNEYGCAWRTPAGDYRIQLHLQVWHPGLTEGVMEANGLGKWVDLDNEKHPRRNYKDLCKAAENITDENLLAYI
jgi:hypothetical protein